MKVRLRHPNGGEVEVAVPPGGLVVGRPGGGADLELPGDARVSRRHGRVWVEGAEVLYEDLGSSNGSWRGNRRVQGPIRLVPEEPVTLGDTTLLVGGAPGPEMTLERRGRAGLDLGGDARISALYGFVQGLLRSADEDRIPRALRRLHEAVPTAQRISLVAWPPRPDGELLHLVPPDGVAGAPISLSLARHAVESGDALLYTDSSRPGGMDLGPSVEAHRIRSAVYVPLLDGEGAPLGVLCVDTPVPSVPFAQQDFEFIRAVGGLLATTLAADRLREDARRRELEARETESRREALVAFLQIASHDLNAPLSVIQLSARALASGRQPVEDMASAILESTLRAHDLIATYLEVSALEQGRPPQVRLAPVDVGALVESEIAFVRRTLDDIQAEVLTFANRTRCGPVQADPQKLRQILANLLANAARYSPDGGEITVSSEVAGDEVILRVADQGVGIAPEDQDRLFQPFQRVGDPSLAPGRGLGLWLTSALVRAHGGRIWVESTPGRGSVFSFALPAG